MFHHRIVITTLVAFVASSLFIPSPALAQRKGDSVSIQYGKVVGIKQVQTQGEAASGALKGGTIGLIAGVNSSGKTRRRRAAGGAAIGAAAGASKQSTGLQYTVETASGMVAVVTDQTEIRKGDCVVVEESGGKANIRRADPMTCEPAAAELVEEMREEFVEEAVECLAAKDELLSAETDEQIDRAIRKISILCNN